MRSENNAESVGCMLSHMAGECKQPAELATSGVWGGAGNLWGRKLTTSGVVKAPDTPEVAKRAPDTPEVMDVDGEFRYERKDL